MIIGYQALIRQTFWEGVTSDELKDPNHEANRAFEKLKLLHDLFGLGYPPGLYAIIFDLRRRKSLIDSGRYHRHPIAADAFEIDPDDPPTFPYDHERDGL